MAYSASDTLLGLTWQENGRFDNVYAHISARETFDFSKKSLADIKSEIFGDYATLLDAKYPEFFRTSVKKAPFCIFWKGPLEELTERGAILILSQRAYGTPAINKYGQFAMVQAIKKYAPKNNIILSITDDYRKTALKTFRKYAGPKSKIIEFTNKSLKDYYLKYDADERCDLILGAKFETGTEELVEGFVFGAIAAAKKVVGIEIPRGAAYLANMMVGLSADASRDIEIVPYPFFDSNHANNKFISDGAEMFFVQEDENND